MSWVNIEGNVTNLGGTGIGIGSRWKKLIGDLSRIV